MFSLLSQKLAYLIKNYSWVLITLAIVLSVLSLTKIKDVKIDADLAHLLPDHFESVQSIKKLKEDFRGSHLVVLFETNPEQEIQTRDFLKRFAKEVQKMDDVDMVEWRRPIDFFLDYQLYFFTVEDLQKINQRFKDQLELHQKGIHPFFQNSLGLLDQEMNPFDFSDLQKKYSSQALNTDLSDELYTNPDNTLFAFLVFPKISALNLDDSKNFIQKIKKLENQIRTQDDQGIQIYYTGGIQNGIEIHQRLKSDFLKISSIVFVLLLLVILIYYKRPSSIFLLGTCLGLSSLWTLIVSTFFFDSLNILSTFSIALLMGLGSDYGIYYLSAYLQNRSQTQKKGFESLYQSSTPAIFLSCLTTALAISSLTFSDFKGFSEFGVISLIGIGCNLISFIVVLPALLRIMERFSILDKEERFIPKNYLHFNFPIKIKYSRLILTSLLFALMYSIYHLPHGFNLEHDVKKMEAYSPPLPSLKYEKKLSEIFSNSLRPAVMIVDSIEEEKQVLTELEKRKDLKKTSPIIKQSLALSSFVAENQENKIDIIKNIKQTIDQFNKNDFLEYFFPSFPEKIKPYKEKELPEEILTAFSPKNPNSNERVILVYPAIDRNNIERIQAFSNEVKNIKLSSDKKLSASGEFLITSDIYELITSEAPRHVLISLLSILVILILSIKNKANAFLIFSSLIVSLIFMIGGMKLFNVRFNLFNIGILPIIIGTSIDSFIHLHEKYISQARPNISKALSSIGPAIIMATCTSLIGYGSFFMIGNEALQTVGDITIIGLASLLITVFLFYPSLIYLAKRK